MLYCYQRRIYLLHLCNLLSLSKYPLFI